MKRIPLTAWFIIITTTILFSQYSKRTNIWYFGRNAGIDFNTSPPTPLLDGESNNWEGTATLCDTFGQLIIYTDGRQIWNRNHEVIPNGTALGGANSATQSGIIVPYPGNPNLIFVFSVDSEGGNRGLQYAVVDLSQNGGLGGIVSKNNELLERCSEKITAIQHCNGRDFWLVAHNYGGNTFHVWEITDSGISQSPVNINIGNVHPVSFTGAIGYMKASPDGSRLALGVYRNNEFEIFDFDNSTGLISNPITINNALIDNSYGVEFSPDGSKLYMSGAQTASILFQVNLDLDTNQEVVNSFTSIANVTSSYFGALQLAPDGKIYIAKDNFEYLSVINNPNELGLQCDFREDDFFLGGRESRLGLPNLIPSYFTTEIIIELTDSIEPCGNLGSIEADFNIDVDGYSYEWYINNELITGQSMTQLTISEEGQYTFVLIEDSKCYGDARKHTQQINISFPDQLSIDDLQLNHPLCGVNDGSISIIESGGVSPYQYSFDNGATFQTGSTLSNLLSGVYEIIVQDGNGCTTNETVELIPINAPEINDVQIVNTSCGLGDGELIISASNGTGQLEYSIDGVNFQQDNSFGNLNSGIYTISIIDSLGCSVETTEEIEGSTVPSINFIQSISTTCGQNNGTLEIAGNNGTPPYEYSIDGINYQTSGNFPDLAEGIYNIMISDVKGCIDSIQLEVESEEPPSITDIDVTQTSCGEDNGVISVTVVGGNNVEYSVDGLNFHSSNSFENLAAGSYGIVIQDVNDCQDTQTVTIESSELPLAQLVEAIPTSCGESNGSIIIEVSGGNLEFSINGIDYQQDNVFPNLPSDIYTVSIKDENDCISTNEVEVANSPELIINSIEGIAAVCGESNGGLRIEVDGGMGIIQVALKGSNFQSSFSFEGLSSGEYDIQVIDEVECLVDTSFVITQEECPIYIPNAFSPNNDGYNDLFKIYPHPDFKGEFKIFKVFDRWGENVFEAQDFNAADIGWDGTHRGKELGIGVYVYFVEYVSENGNSEMLEGDITIIK